MATQGLFLGMFDHSGAPEGAEAYGRATALRMFLLRNRLSGKGMPCQMLQIRLAHMWRSWQALVRAMSSGSPQLPAFITRGVHQSNFIADTLPLRLGETNADRGGVTPLLGSRQTRFHNCCPGAVGFAQHFPGRWKWLLSVQRTPSPGSDLVLN